MLQNAIHRHPRFSRWLERLRDIGRFGDEYREEPQDSEPSTGPRADDDEQESWIKGYSAFWQDLAATWLVAVLIAVIVLAVQSSKDPHRNTASATATTQTQTQTPPGKATRAPATQTPARGEPGSSECTDLDYAYGRC